MSLKACLDAVRFIILQIIIQFFKFHLSTLIPEYKICNSLNCRKKIRSGLIIQQIFENVTVESAMYKIDNY